MFPLKLKNYRTQFTLHRKNYFILIFIVSAISLSSCSTKASKKNKNGGWAGIYSGIQTMNKHNCQKYSSSSLYEECMKNTETSYEEYERERKEISK